MDQSLEALEGGGGGGGGAVKPGWREGKGDGQGRDSLYTSYTSNTDSGDDSPADQDDSDILPEEYFSGFHTEITHNGHNSIGSSLDRRKCRLPDARSFWGSSNMMEMDEAYSCRVLGFASVEEMYQWVSCVDLLNQIDDLPTLIVNSLDDPCVVLECHAIPKAFAGMCIHGVDGGLGCCN